MQAARYIRPGILSTYIFLSAALWFQRFPLAYSHLPIFMQEHFLIVLDIVLSSLLFAGLILLILELHCPFLMRWRVDRAFKQAGLHNAADTYPKLVAVKTDRNTSHGVILKIKNEGLSISDFDGKLPRLQASLKGKVYRIDFARNTTYTLLHWLPNRFVHPATIDLTSKYLCNEPNMLVVGRTGSGKSYFLALLLGIYTRYIPEVTITICDYKKSSFAHFEDTRNFYGYEDVPKGINAVYQEFSERLAANDENRNKHIHVLLIDEYGALISAQDKKTADELRTKVASMLFMGRSLGIRVIIGVQRADAEYFKSGARDQFKAILALGNLSKEQKQMLFSEQKDRMIENNGLGEGYLLIDGKDIDRAKVSEIRDIEQMNANIRLAMGGPAV